MGYTRTKTVKLTWADGELAGLEVRARRVSIAKFLDLGPVLDGIDADGMEGLAGVRDLALEFGKILVSWNLEDEVEDDEGNVSVVPVPCTPTEFLNQDIALVKAIIDAWAEHIAGVAAPLGEPSSSGDQSLEESLPMEVLSPSLAS